MMRVLGILGWFAWMLWSAVALAQPSSGTAPERPGTEFVIVLDNSCSMVESHTVKGRTEPAADPDRRGVLGALLVEGLTRGTDDALTVLAFPLGKRRGYLEVGSRDEIRDLGASSGTFYKGPLKRARKILDASDKRERMLLFVSDGVPNDLTDPEAGREILGLPDVSFDTLVLGLLADDNPDAEGFMQPLARHPEDYVRVTDGASLVRHFTAGYGRSLGSKTLSGTLSPGSERTIDIGRYVTEVLVVTTSVDRTGPYTAGLSAPSGSIRPRATGDNGCSPSVNTRRNPNYCDPPRLHYAVWRAPHDPKKADRWTLRLNEGQGDIAWGVILKTDLTAEVAVADIAKVGEPTTIRGQLVANGEPFDDPAFFERDGFTAEARVAGETIPLEHVGGGSFEAAWTPTRAYVGEAAAPVEVRFSNDWMEKRARDRLPTEIPPPLELETDEVLDFGHWHGKRSATSSCVPLRFRPNHDIDPDQTRFSFDGLPDDIGITISPDGQGQYLACARAKGCCGDLVSPDGAALRISAVDPDGSQASKRVRLRYQVDRTGFLTCWWPWLLALLVLLFILWFLYGWIRPHDFEEDLTIKIGGSERQLNRAASLVLREQPKGRRGFYRNARVALTHSGDFVSSPRRAAVWVEATGRSDTRIHLRGPLEIKDRRSRKWVRVEEQDAADGIRTHVVYRLGDIYFRFQ